MRRMDAGGYSACFDHQQLALMCANSDRTIDRLGAENKQLKSENAKLREYVAWLEEEVIERGYVPSQTKTWLNAKRFELGLEVPS